MKDTASLTLEEYLGINPSLVGIPYRDSLRVAEELWQKKDRPRGKKELRKFLESLIGMCAVRGVQYAPIFLLRLHQLRRGSWSPKRR